MSKRLSQYIPDSIAVFIKRVMGSLFRLSEKTFTGAFDKYDFQLTEVAKRVLKPGSNWIDIGAHKGHIMRDLLRFAPNGKSYGFEPIPLLFKKLQQRFGSKVTLYDYALSDSEGEVTFTYVVERPAISGMAKRKIVDGNYKSEELTVPMKRLDSVIPAGEKIDLIKIDVEGAEVKVLKGATGILATSKPVILFEYGKEGGDIYNTTVEELCDLLEPYGYVFSTMEIFLKNQAPLSRAEFIGQYEKGYNYFFMAYEKGKH